MGISCFLAKGRTRLRAMVCALVVTVVAAGLMAGEPPSASAASGAASITKPPMGWASWNSFAAQINYNVIKSQTDALAASGMKDAGYEYVNIDEGWWKGTRDSAGNITVDTTTSRTGCRPRPANLWRTSNDVIYWGEARLRSRVLVDFDAAQHPGA
ncbi:hypothetical protein [Actinoallomurus sp. CA-150999]|uniref:hypothetical protein n=1 Tax=Actinoallomurus sp. CA-150999 TaxID=3239887 RepID=UPI003D8E1F6C